MKVFSWPEGDFDKKVEIAVSYFKKFYILP